MSLLLRKIRRLRWIGENTPHWVSSDDLPAAPLTDLNAVDNTLSVWSVTEDRSNLEDVLAALASNCDNLTHIDYALFSEKAVAESGLSLRRTEGGTPHSRANGWHREIVQVTAKKLVALAKAIYDNRQQVERRDRTEIRRLLLEAASDGWINLSTLKDGMRQELNQ